MRFRRKAKEAGFYTSCLEATQQWVAFYIRVCAH